LIRAWRYAPAVTAGEVPPDIAVCRELASALRAGDDSTAAGLAARAGIPHAVIGAGFDAGPADVVCCQEVFTYWHLWLLVRQSRSATSQTTSDCAHGCP
jgi:hypothetical protein